MFPRQGREVLQMNHSLNSEFPSFAHNLSDVFSPCPMPIASTTAEYWNSEPEDADFSYVNMLNNPSFPSTTVTGGEFGEVDNMSTPGNNINHTFDTTTSLAGDLGSNTENMDISWSVHSNGPSGGSESAGDFDFTQASDPGYPYHETDSLARFRYNPTAPMAHSPQPDLFLPLALTTPVVDPSTPDSPNSVPHDSIRIPDNPNKRLRISNLTEENILPDNERRKRSKPERLTYK